MKYEAIYTKSAIIDAEDIIEALQKSDKALKEIRIGAIQIKPIYIHKDDEDKDDE